jgi:hypothetical protein
MRLPWRVLRAIRERGSREGMVAYQGSTSRRGASLVLPEWYISCFCAAYCVRTVCLRDRADAAEEVRRRTHENEATTRLAGGARYSTGHEELMMLAVSRECHEYPG